VSDQLDLDLTGDVARLPRTLRPMLARAADAPFDSDEHTFEPRWGGLRALAFVDRERNGSVPRLRLLDETGRDLAPLMSELWSIPELVADLPAILDGEIVMPDPNGRMDEGILAARLAGGAPAASPVFLVFDVPWAGGRPIIALPLERRRQRLARMVTQAPELVVVPGVAGEGMDLYFAVVQQGLRGVMARHLRSPYLPGRRSDLWRWIAARPGEIPLHLVPDPVPGPTRPVLALIQRLPLDD
jgi:ATP-dependent DNA ligase